MCVRTAPLTAGGSAMGIVEDIGLVVGAVAFMGFCYLYALLADRMVSHR